MNVVHAFQKLRRFLILTEGSVNEHQVLDGVWVALVLRLDICKQLLTIVVLAELHQAKCLDRNKERLLLILQ